MICITSASGECKSVGCNSHGKYKRCKVFSSRDVAYVQVKKRKSKKKACKLGRSYGKVAGDIWVNLGCRATFKVCDVASKCDHIQQTTCFESKSCDIS